MKKSPRRQFLSQNPFPHPLTIGFFYREKMRAIHRIAPEQSPQEILEVGGGQSGLSSLLYPQARITNLDLDGSFAEAPCNQKPNVTFVQGDATQLPFPDNSFEMITMFDLIEHVPNDQAAMDEARRVLKPGGHLLLSTPNLYWKYPYYSFLKKFCPTEEVLFEEWGHVRRGYEEQDLIERMPLQHLKSASFINPVTALAHDISFSHLSTRKRRLLCRLLFPVTFLAYLAHRPRTKGTEIAYAWVKQ
ncbi:class I SAM-dependent methyltransferase [Pelagicoccus sp. SDUM812002]|uniref:class I SAM-dependent methyltransferase n=1 Tax=Pelagicoccus sp. SDUM812002 TaxID=3041266 RepID=UPI00280F8608|nr:class I SAM-dependent methyltransferase [Pelagicoccus sp. SDUM812002]